MSTSEPQWLDTQNQQHSLASPVVLRWGQHLVTAILLAIALLRQISAQGNVLPAILVSVLFATWYSLGFVSRAK